MGSRAFRRGRGYARGNRVLAIEWSPEAETLTGSVVGQGAVYSTTAYFAAGDDGAPVFAAGECTCPVGYDCKHVAAIAIAAADGRGDGPASGGRWRPGQAAATQEVPSWERLLCELVEAPAVQATGDPLAIELALHATGLGGRGAPRLVARLMRPGKRGGWVNGSLTWSGVNSWHVQAGEHRADHLALARELYAV